MKYESAQICPAAVREIENKKILIEWQDGHKSLYSLPYLRRECRCAA
jgi:hypothetical protein